MYRCHLCDPGELARIANDRHARHPGCNFLEELKPFATDGEIELSEAGRVATRPRQACDKAAIDGIGGFHKDDRNVARRAL